MDFPRKHLTEGEIEDYIQRGELRWPNLTAGLCDGQPSLAPAWHTVPRDLRLPYFTGAVSAMRGT